MEKIGEVKAVQVPTVREYIQAGYPCLYLPTVEAEVAEERVKKAMADLQLTSKTDFGVWKVTSGLMVGKIGSNQMLEKAKDLIDALAYVETAEVPVIAVFHNVRQFIGNFQVIQAMIDAATTARLQGSTLVLVGPHLELPPELKSVVTLVDCPLPTKAAIELEYKKLVKAYADELTLPANKEEAEELISSAATAAVGLDMMGAENALALSFATTEGIDIKLVQAQKEQEVRKSDVLEFVSTDETMENVGGFDEFKKWLTKRKKAFSEEARSYGLPYPKGVLLVGVGGTGKSLLAQAMGAFLGLPILRLDMGKIFRSLVGESESAMRQALKVAEAVAPVVLWLDEIDKGLAGMKGSGELDSGVTSRVIGTLLTWRQETKAPVVLCGTANDVSAIPSMVFRRGRFDEIWVTDLPAQEEREEIFKIHLRKRGRDSRNFDTEALADQAKDFVGAEIESCIEDAMFSAFSEDMEVETKHILRAIKDTVPQSQRDAEGLKSLREWSATRARSVSGGSKKPEVSGGKVRRIRSKQD